MNIVQKTNNRSPIKENHEDEEDEDQAYEVSDE